MRTSRLFLPIVGAVYAAAAACYAAVWAIDPYDLRPWGAAARLADHSYPEAIVPRLVALAANDGTDLVLFGGSTARGYTPGMLREAFPDSARPVNLSFSAPRSDEFATVLDVLSRSRTVKRVILSLDYTLIKDTPWSSRLLDQRFYTLPWHDPVPEFDLPAVDLSLRVLATGILDRAEWMPPQPDRIDVHQHASLPERPALQRKVEQALEASRSWVASAPAVPCDAMPELRSVVLPFVKRMAERGVTVDLLAPPLSLALYADWSVNYPETKFFPGRGAIFARFMAIRRCAIEMVAGLPNVRVHVFDADLSITGDLRRYYDASHLKDYEAYREILARIAARERVATPATWPQIEAAIRRAVTEFAPWPGPVRDGVQR